VQRPTTLVTAPAGFGIKNALYNMGHIVVSVERVNPDESFDEKDLKRVVHNSWRRV